MLLVNEQHGIKVCVCGAGTQEESMVLSKSHQQPLLKEKLSEYLDTKWEIHLGKSSATGGSQECIERNEKHT